MRRTSILALILFTFFASGRVAASTNADYRD
jgi:hypothetical protein